MCTNPPTQKHIKSTGQSTRLMWGGNFLTFVSVNFEHDLDIVKFNDEEFGNKDDEFTKQFTKYNGKGQ